MSPKAGELAAPAQRAALVAAAVESGPPLEQVAPAVVGADQPRVELAEAVQRQEEGAEDRGLDAVHSLVLQQARPVGVEQVLRTMPGVDHVSQGERAGDR